MPELASREHYRLLGPLYERLMSSAGVEAGDLDVVAVSRGPGLLGALLVGLGFAKGLALGSGARLVGVNHLHAHLLAPGLEEDIVFPAVGLLVSGGHTQLYAVRGETRFELLGRTLDDAAGEAYDKVAKMLNLPYPGGSLLDRLAASGTVDPNVAVAPIGRPLLPAVHAGDDGIPIMWAIQSTDQFNEIANERTAMRREGAWEDYLATVGYDLGPQELASLALFGDHCTRLGLIPGMPALSWAVAP